MLLRTSSRMTVVPSRLRLTSSLRSLPLDVPRQEELHIEIS